MHVQATDGKAANTKVIEEMLRKLSDTSDIVNDMEQILQHIADEEEIKVFHQWISDLCNPDYEIVLESRATFKTILDQTSRSRQSKCSTFESPSETEGHLLLRSLANKYVRKGFFQN